jgi:glucose-1-phosphate adenylyltransferase
MANVDRVISIILGGGAGTRLYPLTAERSKPAVPIGGKYRLIDIPISNCLNSKIKRMFVLTQFNSASLNKHIKNTYHFDHFGFGFVDLLAAEQTPDSKDWFQGTADAVRQSLLHTRRHDYDYLLILSGDQLYQMDFETMLDEHIAKKAELSVATIPVVAREATSFGIMKVNSDGMISDFVEKPPLEELHKWDSEVTEEQRAREEIYLASMGIYIFNRKTIVKLLRGNPDAIDFGKEIIPLAIESKLPVASYIYDGYWTDIGNIKSFYEANLALTDVIPRFDMFNPQKRIYTRPRLLAPAKIQYAMMTNTIVAEACIIHARMLERSLIGLRSRIGEGTVIRSCIIMGNDFTEQMEAFKLDHSTMPLGIGKNCHIEKAIVDKNCRIGDNVIIRGSEELEDTEAPEYVIRDGIVVIKKGSVIEAGTRIGL